MKKFSSIILALLLVLIPCFVMYGCGNNGEPTLKSISLSSNIRTVYYLNENVDFKDAKLSLNYSNDETKTVEITDDMLEGFSTFTPGEKTLKINYEDKTISINYLVADFRLGKYSLTKQEVYVVDSDNRISETNYPSNVCYLQFNLNGTCKLMEKESHYDEELKETVYAENFSLKQTYVWEIRNGKVVLYTPENATYIILNNDYNILYGGIIDGIYETIFTYVYFD